MKLITRVSDIIKHRWESLLYRVVVVALIDDFVILIKLWPLYAVLLLIYIVV